MAKYSCFSFLFSFIAVISVASLVDAISESDNRLAPHDGVVRGKVVQAAAETVAKQPGHVALLKRAAVGKRRDDYHDFLLGDKKRAESFDSDDEYFNFLTGHKKSHDDGSNGGEQGGYWNFVNGGDDWKKRNLKLAKMRRIKRLADDISIRSVHPINKKHRITRRATERDGSNEMESIATDDRLSRYASSNKRQLDWDEFVVGKKASGMEDWDDFVIGK